MSASATGLLRRPSILPSRKKAVPAATAQPSSIPMEPPSRNYQPVGAALDLWKSRDFEVLIEGPAMTGKAQPLDAFVFTPSGPICMKHVQIGQEVLTPGGRAKVVAIYPQGKKQVFRVEFSD